MRTDLSISKTVYKTLISAEIQHIFHVHIITGGVWKWLTKTRCIDKNSHCDEPLEQSPQCFTSRKQNVPMAHLQFHKKKSTQTVLNFKCQSSSMMSVYWMWLLDMNLSIFQLITFQNFLKEDHPLLQYTTKMSHPQETKLLRLLNSANQLVSGNCFQTGWSFHVILANGEVKELYDILLDIPHVQLCVITDFGLYNDITHVQVIMY